MLNGDPLPWKRTVNHVGTKLHCDGTMEQDAKEKRAAYIQCCMNLNQEFECLPSQSKLKLSRIYNSHYSGSHCWNYSGVMFQQLVNSYNVNLRVMFELPDSTHCWLIEALSGYKHARQQIYSRFVKFVNSLYNNRRINVKSLFDSVSHDARSQVGANMKKVLIDTGIPIIPCLLYTSPSPRD